MPVRLGKFVQILHDPPLPLCRRGSKCGFPSLWGRLAYAKEPATRLGQTEGLTLFMSTSSKITSLQAYNLLLYRTALHPEFFTIQGRDRFTHGEYEFESWIFRGGHTCRFELHGLSVCEIVTDQIDHLPERGHVISMPCAGERDHEAEFSDRIAYVTSMQTENLSDHLYLGTFQEMLDHGRSERCLMTHWADDAGRPNLSLVETQRYKDEVHLQSYHLRSDCGLVLRTQSIFQVK